MYILAVDDDPIILELVVEVVRAMGDHTIKGVGSGAEAIEFLAENPDVKVDCFLLDIQMPGMDGITLCNALRTSGAFPRTPIVMLTAMSDKAHIDAAFAAGANDYVVKPFEVFELQTRIRQAEKRAAALEAQMEDITPEEDMARKPGLLEQIHIYDVDNVIDYFALENYVPLLSRRSLFGSVVFGFQIRHIEKIHELATSLQFRGLIADVAETISDHLRPYQYLMSYAGNGTFLCVLEENKIPNRKSLTDNINIAINRLEMQVPTPRGLPVRVCCGDMVRLLGYRRDLIENALVVARTQAEQTAADMDRDFDNMWFYGRTA